MLQRCLISIGFAVLAASAMLAQESSGTSVPPKPADSGPSLEVTMKFIQDKMNEHGTVGFVLTSPGGTNDVFSREYVLVSDVVADSSTCTLHAKTKDTHQVQGAGETPLWVDGKPYNGHQEWLIASTTPFKAVDSITVESAQDARNRGFAEMAHPELTVAYTPAVFALVLKGTKKDAFSFHQVWKVGERPPESSDHTDKENAFIFRDEETANRVAKAMQHAVEVCGGGSQPEPF